MSEHCGSVTAEGNAVCIPSECGCSPSSKEKQPFVLSASDPKEESSGLWKKIRSGFLFGVACVTSPCCTPLVVPLILVALAGTPLAAWIAANLGWVYGGLTLVSVLSLVLGVRWLNQRR